MKKTGLFSFNKMMLCTKRSVVVGILILEIMFGVMPFFYVKVYANFIDSVILLYKNTISFAQLLPCFAAMVSILLFQYICSGAANILKSTLQIDVYINERRKIIDKCTKIPYEEVETESFYNNLYEVERGTFYKMVPGFFSMIKIMEQIIEVAGILLLIGTYSVTTALIVTICFIPVFIVSSKGGKNDYEAYIRFQDKERRMESFEKILLEQPFSEEKFIFNYKRFIEKKWEKVYKEASDILLTTKKKNYFFVKSVSIFVKIVLWVAIGAIIFLAGKGNITIGICTMLIMQIISIGDKLTWSLSSQLYGVSELISFLKIYDSFMNMKEREEKSVKINSFEKVEVKNLKFKYNENGPYVLNGVSFILEKGKNYAVVGENGAGKSTLMKLLLGLYDSYEGSILIDGVELKTISNKQDIFSAMFQDFSKYEIKLGENIFLSGEKTSEKDVFEAMDKLNLSFDEGRSRKGLEMELGRIDGCNSEISGGQWQKVAMLRALFGKGKFMFLDEPTASLDPIVENEIYMNFKSLMKNKPSLLITHRLGAAMLADEIIVLADGKVAEKGTHTDLFNKGGLYHEMFETQRQIYAD